MNPFKWRKERKAEQEFQHKLQSTIERWEKFVWEWHVPLQKESIAARRPFLTLLDEEKKKSNSINKDKLQDSFLSLWNEMNQFDERIVDAFLEWYKSEEALPWKEEFNSLGLRKEPLEMASDIVLGASKTTITMCLVNAKDLIKEEELIEKVLAQDANKS